MTSSQNTAAVSLIILAAPGQSAGQALKGQLPEAEAASEVLLAFCGPAGEGPAPALPFRTVFASAPGADEALEAALAQARGEVLLVVPPGQTLAPGGVRAVARAFGQDRSLSCLTGRRALGRVSGRLDALANLFEEFWRNEQGSLSAYAAPLAFRARDLLGLEPWQSGLTMATPSLLPIAQQLLKGQKQVADCPELIGRQNAPATWGGFFALEMDRARLVFVERWAALRLHYPPGKTPGLLMQAFLLALAVVLVAMFLPTEPDRGLTLAAICLLLLYPANRAFLFWLARREPAIFRLALLAVVPRAVAWGVGTVWASLQRMLWR